MDEGPPSPRTELQRPLGKPGRGAFAVSEAANLIAGRITLGSREPTSLVFLVGAGERVTLLIVGARGRAPEPRRLQVIKGRPGGTRQNGKPVTNSPVVVPAAPPKPHDLGEFGDFMWDLVTPELVRMTILGQIDLVVLEIYCRVYDQWRREDPQSRRWLWLIDRLTTLGIQLGLTPAARLRMNLPERRADEGAVFGADA
jgi:phage terminase small subunit